MAYGLKASKCHPLIVKNRLAHLNSMLFVSSLDNARLNAYIIFYNGADSF